MKFLMLLVYILSYQPTTEKVVFDTLDECRSAGQARVEAVQAKGAEVLVGLCIRVPAQEVSK